MKTILLTLTYTVGIGELILAVYFWVTNSKNEIRRVMALLALSTGMWVITNALDSYQPQNNFAVFDTKLVFVFGIFLLTSLVHLISIYPYPVRPFDSLHAVLFYVPTIIFSISSFVPNLIFLNITGGDTRPGFIVPGLLYNIYNIYLLALFFVVIWLLFYRLHKLSGLHKRNLRLLLFSVLLGGLPAVVLDLLIPLVNPDFQANPLYGNLFTAVWLGVMTYIVAKS